MRDKRLRDEILQILAEVWALAPDLRLGQLLVNAVQSGHTCSELSDIEDGELALRLRAEGRRTRGQGEPMDTRGCWVYEGGWFATDHCGGWYEVNEETHRNGQPWTFREGSRTAEYVELYDASRRVSVRLTATAMLVRWDSAGRDAGWDEYYRGRWKSRSPR